MIDDEARGMLHVDLELVRLRYAVQRIAWALEQSLLRQEDLEPSGLRFYVCEHCGSTLRCGHDAPCDACGAE